MENRKPRYRCGVLAGAALLAGVLAVVGCGTDQERHDADGGKAGQAMPAAPVLLAPAARMDVPLEVRVIGTVEAYSTVTVRSRVSGQLVRVAFQRGQDVMKRDLLFEIDSRPYEAALALAKADLARDQARARNAREEAQFQEEIFQRNAGTKREYDLAMALAEAAEAQVQADQAAVEVAEIQLAYCTIRAPMDGRTGDLLAHQGNIVKADDTALVVINRIQPVYVTFSVAERFLPEVRRYMRAARQGLGVRAMLPQTDQVLAAGTLIFVDNQMDRTTGMIAMKATFNNEDRQLWPGQFVDVVLVLTTLQGVVVVPSQAVQTGQEGSFVFVVREDDTVVSRPVVAGATWQGVTVIEKGDVRPGDRVVTDGHLRLTDGTKVRDRGQSPPTTRPATDSEQP